MDPARPASYDERMPAHAAWLHDLRNAVNLAGISTTLARRLIARGEPQAASDMLVRCENALEQCRELLLADQAVGPGDAADAVRPPAADGPAPHPPRAHRSA